MGDALKFFGAVILGMLLLFGAAVSIAYQGEKAQCRNTATRMGLQYEFSFTMPCMVKVDGRWEPFNWQRPYRIKEVN